MLSTGLGPGWVHADRQSIALDPAADVDLRRADDLGRTVASHEHGPRCDRCRAALDEVVVLHRGPFLDGFSLRNTAEFDVWRAEEVERRNRQLVHALARRAELEEGDGDLERALATLRRWREVEPLDERVHRRLIALHWQRGERYEAHHVYRRCVAALERELGVAPLAATTHLYQSVLTGCDAPTRKGRLRRWSSDGSRLTPRGGGAGSPPGA